jgi:hypothetical protein
MRAVLTSLFVFTLGCGLTSCRRDTREKEPAARQVGREAYRASEDIKRGAKKAAQELRETGKEIRQGWKEAKREERVEPKPSPLPPPSRK